MVNKSLIFLSLIILSSLSMVAAQQEDVRFYHERNTNLTIFEKCRVDGAICDASYLCNMSVLSPSQTLTIDNVEMSGTGIYRNFTLTSENQSVNGIYEATVDCTNSTNSGSNSFFYQVTPNGSKPLDEAQGLVMLGSILFLIIISSAVGFMGIKSTNTTVSLAFLGFSALIMVFTLGLILNVIEVSFGTFTQIISNYSTIYVLFTVLLTVGAIGLIVYSIVVALNMYWQFRGLKDIISVRD